MVNGLVSIINPEYLNKIMRLLKLNSIIHLYTSIYWDIEKNELYIFCDLREDY